MISKIKSYFVAALAMVAVFPMLPSKDTRFGKILDVLGQVVLSVFVVLGVLYVVVRENL